MDHKSKSKSKSKSRKTTAKSKSKSTVKKKQTKASKKHADEDCDLHVGTRVLGFWPKDDDSEDGEWFEGVVQSVDYVERTVDILYDDGDRDDSVPWDNARILDDISEDDG